MSSFIDNIISSFSSHTDLENQETNEDYKHENWLMINNSESNEQNIDYYVDNNGQLIEIDLSHHSIVEWLVEEEIQENFELNFEPVLVVSDDSALSTFEDGDEEEENEIMDFLTLSLSSTTSSNDGHDLEINSTPVLEVTFEEARNDNETEHSSIINLIPLACSTPKKSASESRLTKGNDEGKKMVFRRKSVSVSPFWRPWE